MGRRGMVIVLVVLLGGVAVGLASVAADGVPYTARESELQGEHSLPALLYFTLVTLVDTFLGWAVIPVLLGYWAAPSARWAAAAGAAFAVVALTVYNAGAHIGYVASYQEMQRFDRPPEDIVLPEPSVLDTAVGTALSPLLVMAVFGAFLGALAGYYGRRRPLLLSGLLLAVVAVDLWRRAGTPWLSVANGIPNVLLLAAGLAVVAWTVAATRGTRHASGALG